MEGTQDEPPSEAYLAFLSSSIVYVDGPDPLLSGRLRFTTLENKDIKVERVSTGDLIAYTTVAVLGGLNLNSSELWFGGYLVTLESDETVDEVRIYVQNGTQVTLHAQINGVYYSLGSAFDFNEARMYVGHMQHVQPVEELTVLDNGVAALHVTPIGNIYATFQDQTLPFIIQSENQTYTDQTVVTFSYDSTSNSSLLGVYDYSGSSAVAFNAITLENDPREGLASTDNYIYLLNNTRFARLVHYYKGNTYTIFTFKGGRYQAAITSEGNKFEHPILCSASIDTPVITTSDVYAKRIKLNGVDLATDIATTKVTAELVEATSVTVDGVSVSSKLASIESRVETVAGVKEFEELTTDHLTVKGDIVLAGGDDSTTAPTSSIFAYRAIFQDIPAEYKASAIGTSGDWFLLGTFGRVTGANYAKIRLYSTRMCVELTFNGAAGFSYNKPVNVHYISGTSYFQFRIKCVSYGGANNEKFHLKDYILMQYVNNTDADYIDSFYNTDLYVDVTPANGSFLFADGSLPSGFTDGDISEHTIGSFRSFTVEFDDLTINRNGDLYFTLLQIPTEEWTPINGQYEIMNVTIDTSKKSWSDVHGAIQALETEMDTKALLEGSVDQDFSCNDLTVASSITAPEVKVNGVEVNANIATRAAKNGDSSENFSCNDLTAASSITAPEVVSDTLHVKDGDLIMKAPIQTTARNAMYTHRTELPLSSVQDTSPFIPRADNDPAEWLLLGRFMGKGVQSTCNVKIYNRRAYHEFFLTGPNSTNTPMTVKYVQGGGYWNMNFKMISTDHNGQAYDEYDYMLIQFKEQGGFKYDYDIVVDVTPTFNTFQFADAQSDTGWLDMTYGRVTLTTPRTLSDDYTDGITITPAGVVTNGGSLRYDETVDTSANEVVVDDAVFKKLQVDTLEVTDGEIIMKAPIQTTARNAMYSYRTTLALETVQDTSPFIPREDNDPAAWLLLGRFADKFAQKTCNIKLYNIRAYHEFFITAPSVAKNTPMVVRYVNGGGNWNVKLKMLSVDHNGEDHDEYDYMLIQFQEKGDYRYDYSITVDITPTFDTFQFADAQSDTGWLDMQYGTVTVTELRTLSDTYPDAATIDPDDTVTVMDGGTLVYNETVNSADLEVRDLTAAVLGKSDLGHTHTRADIVDDEGKPAVAKINGDLTENFKAKDLQLDGTLTTGAINLDGDSLDTLINARALKNGDATEQFTAQKLTVAGDGNIILTGNSDTRDTPANSIFSHRAKFPHLTYHTDFVKTSNYPYPKWMLLGRFKQHLGLNYATVKLTSRRMHCEFRVGGPISANTPYRIQLVGGSTAIDFKLRALSVNSNSEAYDEVDYLVMQYTESMPDTSWFTEMWVEVTPVSGTWEFADGTYPNGYRNTTDRDIEIGAPRELQSTDGLTVSTNGTVTLESPSATMRYDKTCDMSQLSVNDIHTAVESKSDKGHTHTISDISSLSTTLAGKADSSHEHTLSDITDWDSSLSTINTAIGEKADKAGSASQAFTASTITTNSIALPNGKTVIPVTEVATNNHYRVNSDGDAVLQLHVPDDQSSVSKIALTRDWSGTSQRGFEVVYDPTDNYTNEYFAIQRVVGDQKTNYMKMTAGNLTLKDGWSVTHGPLQIDAVGFTPAKWTLSNFNGKSVMEKATGGDVTFTHKDSSDVVQSTVKFAEAGNVHIGSASAGVVLGNSDKSGHYFYVDRADTKTTIGAGYDSDSTKLPYITLNEIVSGEGVTEFDSVVKSKKSLELVSADASTKCTLQSQDSGTVQISTVRGSASYTPLSLNASTGVVTASKGIATPHITDTVDGLTIDNLKVNGVITARKSGEAFRIQSTDSNGHGYLTWWGSDGQRKAYLGVPDAAVGHVEFNSQNSMILHFQNTFEIWKSGAKLLSIDSSGMSTLIHDFRTCGVRNRNLNSFNLSQLHEPTFYRTFTAESWTFHNNGFYDGYSNTNNFHGALLTSFPVKGIPRVVNKKLDLKSLEYTYVYPRYMYTEGFGNVESIGILLRCGLLDLKIWDRTTNTFYNCASYRLGGNYDMFNKPITDFTTEQKHKLWAAAISPFNRLANPLTMQWDGNYITNYFDTITGGIADHRVESRMGNTGRFENIYLEDLSDAAIAALQSGNAYWYIYAPIMPVLVDDSTHTTRRPYMHDFKEGQVVQFELKYNGFAEMGLN